MVSFIPTECPVLKQYSFGILFGKFAGCTFKKKSIVIYYDIIFCVSIA